MLYRSIVSAVLENQEVVSFAMTATKQKMVPGEDVQVEVSLDSTADLYAVMVSDKSTNTVQSVMAIPKDESSRRSSRLLQQTRYNQLTGIMTPQIIDQSARRRADFMRNLSPINNDRSSPFDADHHDRRKAQSLPPPSDRTTHSSSDDRRRDVSCAPKLGSKSSSSSEVGAQRACHDNVDNKSRKPNLVANVSRRGFLRSIRPSGRRIHNEANDPAN